MARLDATSLGAASVLALTAACSTSTVHQTTSGGQGGSASGGAPGNGGSTSTTTASSSSTLVTTGSVGAGGGNGGAGGSGAFVCDPPAPADSLYALEGANYPDFQPESMCKYRGDVLLIVNTAAA